MIQLNYIRTSQRCERYLILIIAVVVRRGDVVSINETEIEHDNESVGLACRYLSFNSASASAERRYLSMLQ